MPEVFIVVTYNLLLLILCVGVLVYFWKSSLQKPVLSYVVFGVVLAVLSYAGAFIIPIEGFLKLQLLAWAVFFYYPLYLFGGMFLLFRKQRKAAISCGALAIIILLVCVDAFLIEPHWLEVTQVTFKSAKLKTPVRVAIIADIQTDAPGSYERHVLELVKSNKPDLILMTGDYLHLPDHEEYDANISILNKLFQDADLSAPLGVYAARGNVDSPSRWQEIFSDLSIKTIDKTATLDLGPLVITGLTHEDSSDTSLSIEAHDKYQIVFGHNPDYSLGQVSADLLIAGHTHGGQVQIPFFGPIITLSRVPRSWASGITKITSEKILIVSRGVGMERANAPRLRFLCRPELVIVDLVPDK